MPSLSIYLPDSIMEKVVVEAKEDDTSISKVLTKNYLSSEKVYDPAALIFDRLDLVEKKLDGINEQLAYISGIVLGLASKPRPMVVGDLDLPEGDVGPSKTEKHQATGKSPVCESVWSGGYSKEKQIGKKAKK